MSRPDNIDIDTHGNLWIAGGYRLLADDSTRPPSSMVRFNLQERSSKSLRAGTCFLNYFVANFVYLFLLSSEDSNTIVINM